jgi:hypothetical protein
MRLKLSLAPPSTGCAASASGAAIVPAAQAAAAPVPMVFKNAGGRDRRAGVVVLCACLLFLLDCMNFLQFVFLIPADAARSHLVAVDKPCQMRAGAADQ